LAFFALMLDLNTYERGAGDITDTRLSFQDNPESGAMNGIKFAFPTVQVAGAGDAATAAIAQQTLELTRPKAAE
jgi:hypothetical protein